MKLYDFPVTAIDGTPQTLGPYRGQVVLVVNVAGKCGFTPQYAGLESLYREYKDRGFVVLGFPCNQFMHQEPGNEAEIKQFCSLKYDVTFPMFAKVDVNGRDDTHPLPVPQGREAGLLGDEVDQMELHQVPRGPHGERGRSLQRAHEAREAEAKDRGTSWRAAGVNRLFSCDLTGG